MSLHNKNRRKIICLNNKKVYDCIKDASDELQVSNGAISHICMDNNRHKMIKGFGFYYYDEFIKLSTVDQENLINKFFDYRNSNFIEDKRCVCLETGEVFSGVVEAGRIYNLQQTDIARCCKHKLKHVKNTHWLYYPEYISLTPLEILNIINKYKVYCLETGEIFNGGTVAGKKYGMHWCNVSMQCKNKGKDKRKKYPYHFIYYLDYLKQTQPELFR